MMRAFLLASATAASFGGLRAIRSSSQRECRPRPLRACWITAVAPATRTLRKASSPARVITPSRVLPAVEWSFGVKPIQASMDTNTRQGDLADQASGNNEVHIQLKLKQTDAKILQAIEEALYRMEKGTYGICRDCGEPIAPARLNAIPWTRVCITCKEKQSS